MKDMADMLDAQYRAVRKAANDEALYCSKKVKSGKMTAAEAKDRKSILLMAAQSLKILRNARDMMRFGRDGDAIEAIKLFVHPDWTDGRKQ